MTTGPMTTGPMTTSWGHRATEGSAAVRTDALWRYRGRLPGQRPEPCPGEAFMRFGIPYQLVGGVRSTSGAR